MAEWSFAFAALSCTIVFAACAQQESQTSSRPQMEQGIVVIETKFGNIVVQLFEESARKHAANFKKLVHDGFYDGTTFHRVIPGFVIQGGDPNSEDEDRSNDGTGGPGYTVEAEIGLKHERGFVAAARRSDQVNPKRESNGSQFYICLTDLPSLDGAYTVFGKVVEGMDIVDRIAAVDRDQRDNPTEKVEMIRVYLKTSKPSEKVD